VSITVNEKVSVKLEVYNGTYSISLTSAPADLAAKMRRKRQSRLASKSETRKQPLTSSENLSQKSMEEKLLPSSLIRCLMEPHKHVRPEVICKKCTLKCEKKGDGK
jgi:hypothetical protein